MYDCGPIVSWDIPLGDDILDGCGRDGACAVLAHTTSSRERGISAIRCMSLNRDYQTSLIMSAQTISTVPIRALYSRCCR